jgi:hypothetical protein
MTTTSEKLQSMHNALSKEAIEEAKTRFIEEAEADRGDSAWDCL